MYYCFLYTSNHRTLLHMVETVLQLITAIHHWIFEGECCKCVLHEYVLVNYATKHAVQCGGWHCFWVASMPWNAKTREEEKMCLHRAVSAILLPTTSPLSPTISTVHCMWGCKTESANSTCESRTTFINRQPQMMRAALFSHCGSICYDMCVFYVYFISSVLASVLVVFLCVKFVHPRHPKQPLHRPTKANSPGPEYRLRRKKKHTQPKSFV